MTLTPLPLPKKTYNQTLSLFKGTCFLHCFHHLQAQQSLQRFMQQNKSYSVAKYRSIVYLFRIFIMESKILMILQSSSSLPGSAFGQL